MRALYTVGPPKLPISGETPKQIGRNDQIRERYAHGESIPNLAKAFNLSNARMYQILHNRRK